VALAGITTLVWCLAPHFNHGPAAAGRPPYIMLFGFFSAYCSHSPVTGTGCFIFWLTNALLFGPLFFFFTGTPVPGIRSGKGRLRGFVCSVLFIVSFFSMMWLYRLFPPHTTRWEVFVAVAALLTIASGFRLETCVQGCLGSLPTRTDQVHAEALVGKMVQGRVESLFQWFPGARHELSNPLKGSGGLRLLFQTIFLPLSGLGLSMLVLSGLLLYYPMTAKDTSGFANIFWSVFSMFLWYASLLVLPRVLLQIRWLRTLPVATVTLAWVLTFAPVAAMLAFMGLGKLIFGIVYPIPQMSFLSMVHQGCLLQIALATLLVPLIIWRGLDALVLALVMGMLLGCSIGTFYLQKHLPLSANAGVSLVLILVSFLLTRLLLDRSSRVYRPRTSPTGSPFGLFQGGSKI